MQNIWAAVATMALGACVEPLQHATQSCGNGIIEGDEACDDGGANGPDGPCSWDCGLNTCAAGYTVAGYAGDGTTVCVDINECLVATPCGESATCANTLGSYVCTCPEGSDDVNGDGSECVASSASDSEPPTFADWDPVPGTPLGSSAVEVGFTINEAGKCRWSLVDADYAAMAGTCAGAGTSAMLCSIVGLSEGAVTTYFACQDAIGNEGDAVIAYTIDTTPPNIETALPEDNGTLPREDAVVAFALDEEGECRWSSSAASYSLMENDCTTDGADVSCDLGSLGDGVVDVSFGCADALGNVAARTVSYALACSAGYTGFGDACSDDNECALATHNCHAQATCMNTSGSFGCSCKAGFDGNGTDCARTWSKLAATSSHMCGIDTNGSLWCWGRNRIGQLGVGDTTDRTVPVRVADGPWNDVATGGMHSCALRADGRLFCWGENNHGQLGNDNNVTQLTPVAVDGDYSDWVAVTVGGQHTCGIRQQDENRSVYCWGYDGNGQLGHPETEHDRPVKLPGLDARWRSVSAGESHTCALIGFEEGASSLYCWGSNNLSQLGSDPQFSQYTSPMLVHGECNQSDGNILDWRSVSAGAGYTCGIRGTEDNATLWCWGGGQPGGTNWPCQVGSDNDWLGVASSSTHTCGSRTSGLSCWGTNDTGEVGDGSDDPRPSPVAVLLPSLGSTFAVGQGFTCAATAEGRSYCWGSNTYGQFGNGTRTLQAAPVRIGTQSWQSVSTFNSHTCAIDTGGELYCWGDNFDGQLGLSTSGSGARALAPARVGTWDWVQVAAGPRHTCAIRPDATLWCWGASESGQLGVGNDPNATVPIQVLGGGNWATVGVGDAHSCGLKTDHTLWCWGSNMDGRLGFPGSGNDKNATPVQVGSDSNWTALSVGWDYGCGIEANNTLFCWGNDSSGQLGLGEGSQAGPISSPVAGSWLAVATGVWLTCGVENNGSLSCWGNDFAGLNVQSPTPIAADWNAAVPSLQTHACAVKADGTLVCWGANEYGQLGVGEPLTWRDLPAPQVGTDSDWRSVDVGSNHSCAVKTDDSLWCWGNDDSGQLGDGNAYQTLPLLIP